MRDARSDDTSLAASRASEYQKGTFRVLDRAPLLRVERFALQNQRFPATNSS